MSEPTTPSASETSRHNIVAGGMGFQIRAFKDNLARWVVWVGGLGVIAALMLIFFYLVSEVAPLFESAEFHPRPEYAVPGTGKTLYTTVEEQGEVAMRVADNGEVSFFNLTSGAVLVQQKLPIGELSIISSFSFDMARTTSSLPSAAEMPNSVASQISGSASDE